MNNIEIKDAIYKVFSSDTVFVAEDTPYPKYRVDLSVDGEDILPLVLVDNLESEEILDFYTMIDVGLEILEEKDKEWEERFYHSAHIFEEIEYDGGLVILRGKIAKSALTLDWFEKTCRFLHESTPLIDEIRSNEIQTNDFWED